MKKLIYRYLDREFVVVGNKVKSKTDNFTYSVNLVAELNEVFGLNRKQLKWYIKGWILSKNRNFNFKDYWDFKFSVYIPLATRVNARTIGMDLVNVQPLAAPRGLVNFLEFSHEPIVGQDVGRVDRAAEELARGMEVFSQFRMPVIRSMEDLRQDTIRKWSATGYLDGLTGRQVNQILQ